MHFNELAAVLSLVGLMATLALAVARYPMIIFSLLVIWVAFAWRTASIAHLDFAGPIYAYQIYREVGGAMYAPVFATFCIVTLAPFFLFFGQRGAAHLYTLAESRISADEAADRFKKWSLADLATIGTLFLAALLYVSMISRGPIPLLAGIEQAEYRGAAASAIHNLFMRYQMIFAFALGAVFAHNHIRTGRFHWGLIFAAGVLLAYAFLTGHRFSYFYSFSTQFVAPMAASIGIWSIRRKAERRSLGWVLAAFSRRQVAFALIVIFLLGGVIATALFNSYFNVRFNDSDSAQYAMYQRILVQPTELTWAAFERVFRFANSDGWAVLDFLLSNPIDTERNSSPQYLMLRTVGSDVTISHLSQGSHFAGGFPEVLFEALGPYAVWPVLLALGFLTAGMLFLVMRAVALGHFLSVVLGAYVMYGLLVMYIGGMTNFAMQSTYYLKVAAFAAALLVENGAQSRGIALLPWYLADWLRLARRLVSGLGDTLLRLRRV